MKSTIVILNILIVTTNTTFFIIVVIQGFTRTNLFFRSIILLSIAALGSFSFLLTILLRYASITSKVVILCRV